MGMQEPRRRFARMATSGPITLAGRVDLSLRKKNIRLSAKIDELTKVLKSKNMRLCTFQARINNANFKIKRLEKIHDDYVSEAGKTFLKGRASTSLTSLYSRPAFRNPSVIIL